MRQVFAHDARHNVATAHGNGTLVDNDRVMVKPLRDTAGRALDIAHIGAALACTSGGIDGDKDKLAVI